MTKTARPIISILKIDALFFKNLNEEEFDLIMG